MVRREHKANVNVKNVYGETPLHIAAHGGYLEICELLITKGADVNAKNDKRETPLDITTRLGYANIRELLEKSLIEP